MSASGSTSRPSRVGDVETFTATTVDGVTVYDLSGGCEVSVPAAAPDRQVAAAASTPTHRCWTWSSRSTTRRSPCAASVARVVRHLRRLPYTFRVTIADNASTDGTALVAHRLSHEYDEVRAVFLPEKGRGRALKQVWSRPRGRRCWPTWTWTSPPT